MILTVPDYIPINLFTYFSYFLNLFTLNSLPIKKKEEDEERWVGRACNRLGSVLAANTV